MFVYYIINPMLEGGLFISESYDDWDACYDDYYTQMKVYKDEGIDLAQSVCRGVQEQGA